MDLWSIVVVVVVSIVSVHGTIDVNLSELEYLAARLDLEECRRLVAALHYHSFELPESLEDAERSIAEDIPCLSLLLHWNSAKSEGLGESHELLERRLRQLGRRDLADWLGKTTFRELGKDLLRSINEPFPDVTSISSSSGGGTTPLPSTNTSAAAKFDDDDDDDDWKDEDFWMIIEMLMIGLFCLLLFTLIFATGALVIDKFAWCDDDDDDDDNEEVVSVDNRKLLSIN